MFGAFEARGPPFDYGASTVRVTHRKRATFLDSTPFLVLSWTT